MRSRFREEIIGRDDLSIDVLELLGMVVGTRIFIAQSATKPGYAKDSVRMHGDNSSAVAWMNKCQGGKEPLSGALMRILGFLEMDSDCHFDCTHVQRACRIRPPTAFHVGNTSKSINERLHVGKPGVIRREKFFEREAVDLRTTVVAVSSSATLLHRRL